MASGVVALLDNDHMARVEGLWQELQDKFEVSGVEGIRYPHISLIVAESFDAVLLESDLNRIVSEMPPLTVRTTGLGIYTGIIPVVFITVVRDATLATCQARIWEKLAPAAAGVQTYYHPDHWQPHITIAQDEILPDNLPQLIELLYARDFNWTLQVDRLAFISDSGTGQGHTLHSEYPLSE